MYLSCHRRPSGSPEEIQHIWLGRSDSLLVVVVVIIKYIYSRAGMYIVRSLIPST